MENQTSYDFEYSDNENDVYSENFSSKALARAEWKRMKKQAKENDEDLNLIQTWVYNANGEYTGGFTM